jgi:tetratricopeptide (TPR) repeat protein
MDMKAADPAEQRSRSHKAVPVSGVGDRLRSLRLAAGMTQTDLAGERFSKEYVSQIERGKTRPTPETIEWIAGRLGVDPRFLSHGVASDERNRIEAVLARADVLIAENRFDEASAELEGAASAVAASGVDELELRLLLGQERALAEQGDPRKALELLQRARALAEGPDFSDVERAEVVFRLGVARYKLSSIQTAVALFDEAAALALRSGLPCDRLLASVFDWRSRCRRRQRDYEAAREDAARAIELAEAASDLRAVASATFQASLVAERMGHMVMARNYALQAKALLQLLEDDRSMGRLMLNLGGLQFLLGQPGQAIEHLNASFALAVECESQPDAAQALGSLATVHLELGDFAAAADHARRALELLDGREDFLDEIGQSRIVLGRALLEQGLLDEAEECFTLADAAFEQYASASHRAGAWVALGDLAARRGDDRRAAQLYRRAAEALRDVRF